MSTDRTTEILNYLSAISREVGELRAEMRTNFEAIRADLRRLERKVEVMTQDVMDVRANQRDLESRVRALESKQA